VKRKDDDTAFRVWMGKVDAQLTRLCGLTSNDLPDINYRDLFCDGCSAKTTAHRAYRNSVEG